MNDPEGFIRPPPSAERYFNIARGDDPTWESMPNGPNAVSAFALLSIAKSLMDLRELLGEETEEDRRNKIWGEGNWVRCEHCEAAHHKEYHNRGAGRRD